MFFNREPFRTDLPTFFKPVGKVERPDWTEYLFQRKHVLMHLIKEGIWTPDKGLKALPGPVGDYYRKRPNDYETMMKALENSVARAAAWKAGKHQRYAIADAYNASFRDTGMYNRHGSTVPEDPADVFRETGKPIPPEEWGFRHIWRKEPMKFKSPSTPPS